MTLIRKPRLVAYACLTMLCVALAITPALGADPVTLIKAAHVVVSPKKTLSPGMVLIQGRRILQVGAKVSAPKGAKTMDVGSGTVMAGMVDANARVPLPEGSSEITREVTANYSTYLSINVNHRRFRELHSQGITTVAVLPGTDAVIAGMACVVKTSGRTRSVDAVAALLVNVCSDPRAGNGSRVRPNSIYIRQPTNRMGVVWILRHTLDREKKSNGSRTSYLARLLRQKVHVMARSRTAYDIRTALKIAREHEFTPTIVGGEESYKVADLLAQQQVSLILSPVQPILRNGREGTEVVPHRAALLKKAGVRFAFSGGNLLDQARFAVRFGLSKSAALAAITSNPAYILGRASELGTVETGKTADLVALTGDPFELTSRIRWVMVDGKLTGPSSTPRRTRRSSSTSRPTSQPKR